MVLFRLGCIEINDACLQNSPINRDIYVRPLKELGLARSILWKLQRMQYTIKDAGRQWAKVIDGWMIQEAYLE